MKTKEREKLLKRIAKLERENWNLRRVNRIRGEQIAELRRGQGTWVEKGDQIGHDGNTGHWNPNAAGFDGGLIASGGWGTGPNSPQPLEKTELHGDINSVPPVWDDSATVYGDAKLIESWEGEDYDGSSVLAGLRQTSDPVFCLLENGTRYTIADNGAAEIQMPGGGVLIMPAELLKDINIIHFDKGDDNDSTKD